MLHAWHDYITDHEGDQEDELSMEDLQETTARIHTLLDAEAALVKRLQLWDVRYLGYKCGKFPRVGHQIIVINPT